MRLFDRQGYHGTGLAEILQTAGSPRGSLYFHFPGGKEEIGVEAVNLAAAAVEELILGVATRQREPAELVRALGRALGRWLERSAYQEGCAVLAVTVETANLSEPLRLSCANAYARWEKALSDAFVAAGTPTREARRIATLTVAALEGALAVCRARRSAEPMTTAADTLASLLEQG